MHGRLETNSDFHGEHTSLIGRSLSALRQRSRWLSIVVLPTLVIGSYFWFIAAPQYVSEAHFLVRSTQASGTPASGLGQALTMIGGINSAPLDSASVSDYLSSHDAVDRLRKEQDLVARFERPEADFLSRLTPANPSPERLLRYYRDHVTVKLDSDTGLTNVTVRSFRPNDSYELVDALLRLGEQRVNTLNQRAYDNTLQVARKQLQEAETSVAAAQQALTNFRQQRRNIDPVASGQAQIGVVSNLQANLAQARAARAALSTAVAASSPQARALDARIAALQTEVASESARLAGGASAIASNVGDYQSLQLRQQFAAKRYDDAAAALQRAREQAQRQQLFIVRVVQPNVPVKALYPKSTKVLLTVFLALAICYALGWLIVAGVREHAA